MYYLRFLVFAAVISVGVVFGAGYAVSAQTKGPLIEEIVVSSHNVALTFEIGLRF